MTIHKINGTSVAGMKAMKVKLEMETKLSKVVSLLKIEEPNSTDLLAVSILLTDIIALKPTYVRYRGLYGVTLGLDKESKITTLTRRFKKGGMDARKLYKYNNN